MVKCAKWTKDEDEFILANPRMPRTEMATRLGRTAGGVYKRAEVLGAVRERYVRNADVAAEVERLHSLGETVKDIATILGIPRHLVKAHHRLLGLKGIRDYRASWELSRQTTVVRHGTTAVAVIRRNRFEKRLQNEGWPTWLTPLQYRIAEAVYTLAICTIKQLIAMLGGGTSVKINMPTLVRRGLVIRSPRVDVDERGGYPVSVYSLSQQALCGKLEAMRRKHGQGAKVD